MRTRLLTSPLAFAGAFVAVDVLIDHVMATAPGTYHHARPAALAVPALAMAAILWSTRSQLGAAGRLGALLTLAGAVGNAACLVIDPAGVSDYLGAQVGRYLVVVNVADLAIVAGLVLVLCSAIRIYAARLLGRGLPGRARLTRS